MMEGGPVTETVIMERPKTMISAYQNILTAMCHQKREIRWEKIFSEVEQIFHDLPHS